MFTGEQDIKSFLKEYMRSRVVVESTVKANLNRALEFEKKYKKPFYEFNVEEILAMYESIHTISVVTLQNINLLLKHAARWFIDSKNINNQSAYENISKELLLSCVDIAKKEKLILDKNDLKDIQNQLLNYTDKGILEILFLGAGGNWLKELTFFDISQISHKDKLIYFRTGKTIPIEEDTYNLIKEACAEEELISFGTTNRISRVKTMGFYKVRFNALSFNDNPNDEQDQERRFRFIQRRLMLISKDLGITLTSGALQTSGLLYNLKQGVNESGLNFREYIKTKEAKELARRYDILSDLYGQILIEKFEKYFE